MIASVNDANASPLQSLIDRAPLTALQVRVVLLCALAFVTEGIDLGLIPLLAPSMAKDWSLPMSAFGLILGAGPIGLIIGGFAVGYVADHVGRRWALIGAMALMTLATAATAWTSTVPELLVCRVLTGIGFGGVIPAASTLVSEFMPTRTRASVVAFVILGQALGALLSALMMKIPQVAGSNWQGIIVYVSVVCAGTTLLLAAWLPESPRFLLLQRSGSARLARTLQQLCITEAPAAPAVDAAQLNINRVQALFGDGRALGTCLLWMTFIGVCATVSFFSTWLTLLYTHAGKPASDGVSAFAAYSAGAIAGGLVLPLFCARWHANRVLMAAILAGGLSSAALGSVLSQSASVNLVMAFICGVFVSGAFFMLYPPAVRFYPTAIRSTGIGAAVAFGRIGNWASPTVTGALVGAGYSATSILWFMGAPMFMSFVALVIFHRVTGAKEMLEADLPIGTAPVGSAPGSAAA